MIWSVSQIFFLEEPQGPSKLGVASVGRGGSFTAGVISTLQGPL